MEILSCTLTLIGSGSTSLYKVPLWLEIYLHELSSGKKCAPQGKKMKMKILNFPLMQMKQENFYFNLVLFTFTSQLYSYVLGPSSLLSY